MLTNPVFRMIVDEEELCLLCGESLSKGNTVTVTKGLSTIINISTRRKDGISQMLEGLSSIFVHVACRKTYTRDTSIESVLNPSPKKAKSLRSSLQAFDFKLNCLFCGDECDKTADQRKQLNRRDVYEVRSIDCKESIKKAAERRSDEWGHAVRARIDSVFDLVAAEGKYPNSCYKKFYKVPSIHKRGRPQDAALEEALKHLFSFLNNNDDCQYPIEELLMKLECYGRGFLTPCNEGRGRGKWQRGLRKF